MRNDQPKVIFLKDYQAPEYLIFDTGVINIRKYTAYQLAVQQL